MPLTDAELGIIQCKMVDRINRASQFTTDRNLLDLMRNEMTVVYQWVKALGVPP